MSITSNRARAEWRRSNLTVLLARRAERERRDDIVACFLPTTMGRRILARAMKSPIRVRYSLVGMVDEASLWKPRTALPQLVALDDDWYGWGVPLTLEQRGRLG